MPGYVGRYSVPTAQAIRLVKAAGGKAVLAHPWSRGSDKVLTPDRIAELVDFGLDGIEVDHPDHSEEQREGLRKIAATHDLVVTGSSDYHGTGKSEDFRLGANTTSPEELERLLGLRLSVSARNGQPGVGEALGVLDGGGVGRVLDDVDLGAEPLGHRGLDVVRPGVVVGAAADPDRQRQGGELVDPVRRCR